MTPAIAVVMTTADRARPTQGLGSGTRGANYVGLTLAALASQGIRPRLFATSPDVRWLAPILAPLGPVALVVPARTLTRIENGAAAMREPPAGEWVLHLEDDVLPCADALGSVARWLERHGREDRRIVLFWRRELAAADEAGAGVAEHPRDRLFGAVAVAMRRADAFDFGSWALAHRRRWRSGMARLRGFDKMMRAWHRDRYPELPAISASVPSLFQHIGKDSSLAHLAPHGDFWQSPTFTGAAYD